MKQVWKYTLVITDTQPVEMPEGAELLCVADQYGKINLWARVEPANRPLLREILVRGTGHLVGAEPYVGTVVTAGGALVWHVFDGGES